MIGNSTAKAALLAVVALTAASAPTHVAASTIAVPANSSAHAAASSDQADEAAAPEKANKMALTVLAAGVLAVIVKIIGVQRLLRAAGKARPVMVKAARLAAYAPLQAAKAVGAFVMSPLKFALSMAGLALVAFIGIGVFDLEWTAGLAVGVALTALTWFGAERLRREFEGNRVKLPVETPISGSDRNRFPV